MLLDVEKITCDKCPPAIEAAILARHPEARVTVDVDTRRVRVEGVQAEQSVIDALASAGYPAFTAAPHSGPGSDCCGGCS